MKSKTRNVISDWVTDMKVTVNNMESAITYEDNSFLKAQFMAVRNFCQYMLGDKDLMEWVHDAAA